MFSNFQWPIPASFELPPGEEFAGHEPAILMFVRGPKLGGSLTRFLPSHGTVDFLPERGRVNIEVPIADLLQLRLTRPIIFKPRATQLEQHASEVAKPSLKQPFRMELRNGEVLTGETMGFEQQGAGVFLYVTHHGDAVLRLFIPATSIKSQEIGKPLGQMLVDEKLLTQTQVEGGLTRQRELREQSLGELLTAQKAITREDLRAAIERQRSTPMVKLGEALVASKVISEDHLAQALEQQKNNRSRALGEILIDLKHLSRADLNRALAQKLGIPVVDLKQFRIDPAAIKRVPGSIARDFHVVPLCFDDETLVLAMSNPLDPAPIEKVRFFVQGPVTPVMAFAEDIADAIDAYYSTPGDERAIEDLATQLSAEAPSQGAEDEQIQDSDSTLVHLVNKVIMDAHAAGASDIHIESNPGRANVRIRFRCDGTLWEYLQVGAQFRSAIVSRIKIMANIDISERRRGQDGRINFQQFAPLKLELRVATIPTSDGLEDVVLRLLAMREPLPLLKLGLRDPVREGLAKLLERSHGLILCCGPTGSGKTTTLHSLLGVLNAPSRKIWTAEDPVEITQPGLRQVQVHARIGWTFASTMRSFLRADPDVIMVGEMRDHETAQTGIEASLTGHLVFSTLHTNSAAESITRLLDMGIDPFSFSDALLGIMAQRLIRTLCKTCRELYTPDADEVQELVDMYGAEWIPRAGVNLAGLQINRPKGCPECANSGYRGRMGIHELLVCSPKIKDLIQQRSPVTQVHEQSMHDGMETLMQDGVRKLLQGVTTIGPIRMACMK